MSCARSLLLISSTMPSSLQCAYSSSRRRASVTAIEKLLETTTTSALSRFVHFCPSLPFPPLCCSPLTRLLACLPQIPSVCPFPRFFSVCVFSVFSVWNGSRETTQTTQLLESGPSRQQERERHAAFEACRKKHRPRYIELRCVYVCCQTRGKRWCETAAVAAA